MPFFFFYLRQEFENLIIVTMHCSVGFILVLENVIYAVKLPIGCNKFFLFFVFPSDHRSVSVFTRFYSGVLFLDLGE